MSVKDYLEMTRPANSLMVGFAVIIGAVVGVDDPRIILSHLRELALGYATGSLLAASAMVLNDVIDRDIDAFNAPNRPLPSGRVSVRGAMALFFVLSGLGLLASLAISVEAFILALVAYLVAVLYNVWGKRTGLLGNLMVSYTVMTPIIYGSAVVGNFSPKALVFASIIFLANTGREVTKGIVDVYGDEIKGIRTIAVVLGRKAAAYVAVAFYMSAVVLSFIPYLMGMAGLLYLALVLVVDAGFVYYSWRLVKSPDKNVSHMVKNRVLILMFLGLVAFGLSSF